MWKGLLFDLTLWSPSSSFSSCKKYHIVFFLFLILLYEHYVYYNKQIILIGDFLAGMLLYKAADVLRECFTRLLSFGIVVPIRLAEKVMVTVTVTEEVKKESEKKYSIRQHQKKSSFPGFMSNKMYVCTKKPVWIFMEDVEYVFMQECLRILYECLCILSGISISVKWWRQRVTCVIVDSLVIVV